MRFFQDIPIKYKIRVIVMVVSSAALVLACATFVFYEVINFRRNLVSEMTVLSKIIANRSTAALSFYDTNVANETLSALSAKPSVICAYILDADYDIFAEYHREKIIKDYDVLKSMSMSEEHWRFENNHLLMVCPVMLYGERIGTVFIRTHLNDMYVMIRNYLSIVGIVLIFSSLAAFYLLSKLQHVISKPILDLAHAACSFSENLSFPSSGLGTMNFSIRVEKQGRDEMGVLVDAFNNMLDQIALRDTALIESVKKAEASALEAQRLAEETRQANTELENEITERKQAERRLKESEEKYRNIFDFAPEGILITDFDGTLISFNNAAVKIFKYDEPIYFSQLSSEDFYQYPEVRTELIKRLYADGHLENYEVTFKDKQGLSFVASLSSQLIQYEGKTCIQSIVRDVTRIKSMEDALRDYAENLEKMVEKKTAELKSANTELSFVIKNLEETREQLAFKAHQAGMAELAVSVLHNIGNAINSVNVRMYHHEERLNTEEIESFEKIYHLLKSEDIIFANSLSSDRKEKLLRYFDTTIKTFKESRQQLKTDCEIIKKGLDHLMEIISLQQKYAGVRGTETIEDVNELLKDAVEMMMDSIKKRKINMEFDLTSHVSVKVNRNKMIQIFLNIIKNAYESIDAVASENNKKIRISTCFEKTDRIKIVIADTGIGMSSEVLESAFRFNYSTKERGTGFGLHDAANYIKAQNGIISLHSQGVGKGAELTIELPVSKGEHGDE